MTDKTFVEQMREASAASRKLTAASRNCPHGKIKQVCDRCMAEKTISDLEAKLRVALNTLKILAGPDILGETVTNRAARTALEKIGRMP